MRCAAGNSDTSFQCLSVSVGSFEQRQQSRVDVNEPTSPQPHKITSQNSHETSQTHYFYACSHQFRMDSHIKFKP
jgi:hypothetical protein